MKKKKIMIIILIIIAVLLVSILIGLMVTGYAIGWGPFAEFRYFNQHSYQLVEEEYKYEREKITIEGKNGNIAANLYKVESKDVKQQIVILSHGLATEMWHNINYAVSLAKAGINVLMFDYCGGSIHSKSDMDTTEMSIFTEKQDLNDVIDYVKTLDFVDKNRISIIGYSQGGLVAAMTVVERDDIYKLVLNYPAFSMYEQIKCTYNSVDEIPETLDRNGMLTGKVYYEDIVNCEISDIYDYCATYSNPTLFIHGTADLLVEYNVSVKANNLYADSSLITIQNGGHGFTGEDDYTAIEAIYNFLK